MQKMLKGEINFNIWSFTRLHLIIIASAQRKSNCIILSGSIKMPLSIMTCKLQGKSKEIKKEIQNENFAIFMKLTG